MADTKISALAALTGANTSTSSCALPIYDAVAGSTKKIIVDELLIAFGTTSGTTSSTFTFDGSGGSSGSITLSWIKRGNWVTLNLPPVIATTGTNSTALSSNTALPAAIRPTNIQDCPVNNVVNSGGPIAAAGIIRVATAGTLSILRDHAGTAFTNSTSCGIGINVNGTTITYFIG